MQVIVIANEKGGAGKTSTAAAIWYYLNSHGRAALGVDLDPQGNFSFTAGARTDGATIMGALMRETQTAATIQHTRAGDFIAASPLQNAADTTLNMIGKEYRLKECLEEIAGGYEFCIVDTAPHIGILTINALTAADHVILPMQADIFSIAGAGQLWQNMKDIRQYYNHSLQVDGILLTRYSDRTRLSKDLRDMLQAQADTMHTKVFRQTIREAVAVRESQVLQKSIFEHAPKSAVAQDYQNFIEEFLGGIANE